MNPMAGIDMYSGFMWFPSKTLRQHFDAVFPDLIHVSNARNIIGGYFDRCASNQRSNSVYMRVASLADTAVACPTVHLLAC